MTYIDPLKVVRNPATLAAWRRYQRDLRAAGQPWLAIAAVAVLTEFGLVLYGLWRHSFANVLLIEGSLLVFGASFAMAGFWMWRHRRAHPFELP